MDQVLVHTPTGTVPLVRIRDRGGITWVGSKDVCNKLLPTLAKSTFQHNLAAAGVLLHSICMYMFPAGVGVCIPQVKCYAGAIQRPASLAERGYLQLMGGIKTRSSKVTLIQAQGFHQTLVRIGSAACLLSSTASLPEMEPYTDRPRSYEPPVTSSAAVKPELSAPLGEPLL